MSWFGGPGYWADGSTMAFALGERLELTSIGSTPFGGPSVWMEGLAKPLLPLGALAASPMLSWLSTAASLAPSFAGTLLVAEAIKTTGGDQCGHLGDAVLLAVVGFA